MLEKQEAHNPVPLIVGSSVGGLLLLALITFLLYKVRAASHTWRLLPLSAP